MSEAEEYKWEFDSLYTVQLLVVDSRFSSFTFCQNLKSGTQSKSEDSIFDSQKFSTRNFVSKMPNKRNSKTPSIGFFRQNMLAL